MLPGRARTDPGPRRTTAPNTDTLQHNTTDPDKRQRKEAGAPPAKHAGLQPGKTPVFSKASSLALMSRPAA